VKMIGVFDGMVQKKVVVDNMQFVFRRGKSRLARQLDGF